MRERLAYIFPAAAVSRGLADFHLKPASFWERKGQKMALSLYSFCKEHVPAYRAHLEKAGALETAVNTIRDFRKLPLVSKDSYLRAHPYESLFPPLGLHRSQTVSATSGSTGEPFFFPRSAEHDALYERSMEVLLSQQWDVGKRSTLCIIGFGLGIWIGGVFTYKVFNRLAEKKLPMTLVPVGPNKDLYLRSFKKFANDFDQIILMGYPPFMKELLDAGKEHGIDWTKYRLRILTAAEGYSEEFRNHLAQLSGADPVKDMVNIYGTVEQGTIAHETALANMIRRIAHERPDVFRALFPEAATMPTLAQYYPDHVYFEQIGGQIVATGYGSSIPLVRYAFNDLGGVIGYDDMRAKLAELGIDLDAEAAKYGIAPWLKLPFVYVHARADFVIVFRGANIYPEEVRTALDSPVLQQWITGKCALERTDSPDMRQSLDIHVELNPSLDPTDEIAAKVLEAVVSELRAHNSEFANNYAADAAASTPRIVLHHHGDPHYFSGAGKQRWVRK